ncbi:hypothetical protein LIA77_05611 [Sarocladium implicatum]|nr:hypothetical protein LIA77_05611 [Sarocladium implicatum]
MTFGCDGSPSSSCDLPASPEEVPPGFKTTTTVCDTGDGGPVTTYTLTVPDGGAATPAESSGNFGASGNPGHGSGDSTSSQEAPKSVSPEAVPSREPGTISDNLGTSGDQTTEETKADNTGSARPDGEAGSGETVEVSSLGSAVSMDIKRAVEVLLMSVLLMGINL